MTVHVDCRAPLQIQREQTRSRPALLPWVTGFSGASTALRDSSVHRAHAAKTTPTSGPAGLSWPHNSTQTFLFLFFHKSLFFLFVFFFVPIESLGVNRVLNWKLRPISSTCLTPSGSSGSATFAQKQHEFSQVRLGLLQHFDFSNQDILGHINRLARLFCVFAKWPLQSTH